ncbi:MAG TPA: rRNA adenine N-6-methyltransferase family protein, partial [Cryobacterium sp.]|nr:rRNA adenine N-6-methyltransferase family protein [Cryobacterium sp.]
MTPPRHGYEPGDEPAAGTSPVSDAETAGRHASPADPAAAAVAVDAAVADDAVDRPKPDSAPAARSLHGPAEIRDLAEMLGVNPTKKRGQNFVIDGNTVRRIVKVATVSPGDTVLEVGPGLGSLTLGLL